MRLKKPIAAFVADIHWTGRTPEYRKETCSFYTVIAKKLMELTAYAKSHGIPTFVAGDTFDRSRDFMDMWTMRQFLLHHAPCPQRIYAVPGQHDLFHHNPNDRATSLNAIIADDGCLTDMPDVGMDIGAGVAEVYGAGWGQAIPIPENPEAFNVLVWHKTLWHRTPVYPGQTEGNVTVEAAHLSKVGYKMVFSGDNHKAFDVETGGVRFHNIGAFTRDDVTLKSQQPRFCVLFDDLSVESVYVGEKDVFDLGRSDADKGREDKKDEFSEALAGGFDGSLTFKGNLEAVAKSGECGEAVLTERQKGMVQDVVNAI